MTPAGGALTRVRHRDRAMGGRFDLHLATQPGREAEAADLARRVASRVRRWERRLTRFDRGSELSRLNADPAPEVRVGPTLAAVLAWARDARETTRGIVDISLLDERLAAEEGSPRGRCAEPQAPWRLGFGVEQRTDRWATRGSVVLRPPTLRLDLDGVAKGWIADRALDLLVETPGALVDADGDLAARVAPGDRWQVGIADPRTPGFDLAVITVEAGPVPLRVGVATSGVSVHRWGRRGRRHHLIDPRTRRPADTDLVQVTVLAATAREAEALAKAAVILGGLEGTAFLDASPALGAVLLPRGGPAFALMRTLPWLVETAA